MLQGQYITEQTLYITHLREANDVLKLRTPRQLPRKKKKFSGGFRGVSVLESEVTESVEVDAVSDEIRRWSSLSEDECQRFVTRSMWSKFSHGWDNFQKLILTPTPSLTWFRSWSTSSRRSPLSKISWTSQSTMRCSEGRTRQINLKRIFQQSRQPRALGPGLGRRWVN